MGPTSIESLARAIAASSPQQRRSAGCCACRKTAAKKTAAKKTARKKTTRKKTTRKTRKAY